MANLPYRITGYGLSDALPNIFPSPVVAKRAPTANDTGYAIGQEWVYSATNQVYFLSAVVAGSATWVNVSGGSGSFTSLTVTGPTTLTGATNINTSGAAVTNIGVGGTGAVHIGNVTGNTNIAAGNFTVTSGNVSVPAGSLSSGLSITAGNALTVTYGDATITNGNLILSAAATYISLPGPVFIYSGAGAPSNGLALHIGDMYINTTAASAVTRLYIATAVGTWTNVTCAA